MLAVGFMEDVPALFDVGGHRRFGAAVVGVFVGAHGAVDVDRRVADVAVGHCDTFAAETVAHVSIVRAGQRADRVDTAQAGSVQVCAARFEAAEHEVTGVRTGVGEVAAVGILVLRGVPQVTVGTVHVGVRPHPVGAEVRRAEGDQALDVGGTAQRLDVVAGNEAALAVRDQVDRRIRDLAFDFQVVDEVAQVAAAGTDVAGAVVFEDEQFLVAAVPAVLQVRADFSRVRPAGDVVNVDVRVRLGVIHGVGFAGEALAVAADRLVRPCDGVVVQPQVLQTPGAGVSAQTVDEDRRGQAGLRGGIGRINLYIGAVRGFLHFLDLVGGGQRLAAVRIRVNGHRVRSRHVRAFRGGSSGAVTLVGSRVEFRFGGRLENDFLGFHSRLCGRAACGTARVAAVRRRRVGRLGDHGAARAAPAIVNRRRIVRIGGRGQAVLSRSDREQTVGVQFFAFDEHTRQADDLRLAFERFVRASVSRLRRAQGLLVVAHREDNERAAAGELGFDRVRGRVDVLLLDQFQLDLVFHVTEQAHVAFVPFRLVRNVDGKFGVFKTFQQERLGRRHHFHDQDRRAVDVKAFRGVAGAGDRTGDAVVVRRQLVRALHETVERAVAVLVGVVRIEEVVQQFRPVIDHVAVGVRFQRIGAVLVQLRVIVQTVAVRVRLPRVQPAGLLRQIGQPVAVLVFGAVEHAVPVGVGQVGAQEAVLKRILQAVAVRVQRRVELHLFFAFVCMVVVVRQLLLSVDRCRVLVRFRFRNRGIREGGREHAHRQHGAQDCIRNFTIHDSPNSP